MWHCCCGQGGCRPKGNGMGECPTHDRHGALLTPTTLGTLCTSASSSSRLHTALGQRILKEKRARHVQCRGLSTAP